MEIYCHRLVMLVNLVTLVFAHTVSGSMYGPLHHVCPGTIPGHRTVKIHDGKCYEFIRVERYWDDARRDCQSRGGDLIQIRDQAMQKFVMDSLANLHWGKNGLWIGAHDMDKEMHWEWVTGERVTWGYWEPGQPSCHPVLKFLCAEDCAVLRINEGGRWHDYRCHSIGFTYTYICQYDMIQQTTQKPLPSTTKPSTSTTQASPKNPTSISTTVSHPRTKSLLVHTTESGIPEVDLSKKSSSSIANLSANPTSISTTVSHPRTKSLLVHTTESGIPEVDLSKKTSSSIANISSTVSTETTNSMDSLNSTSTSTITETYSEKILSLNETNIPNFPQSNIPNSTDEDSVYDYTYNDLPPVVAAKREDKLPSATSTSYTGLIVGITVGVFIICGILMASLVYYKQRAKPNDDMWAVSFDNPNYGRPEEAKQNESENVNEVIYDGCGDVRMYQPETMNLRSEECVPDMCESTPQGTSDRFENPYSAVDFCGQESHGGSSSPKLRTFGVQCPTEDKNTVVENGQETSVKL